MAIDSSLFAADIPAATYAAGDVVPLGCVSGPAVVRSGRGAAMLKRVTVGLVQNASGSISTWKIYTKNSDWVDSMCSATAPITTDTSLDERSGCVQRGNDCPLTPNSSWEVYAVCVAGITTTVANSIFALIDVDYPSVSSITDPDRLLGIPTSIEYDSVTIVTNAIGSLTTASWSVVNVDVFKAGYEYALQKIEYVSTATSNLSGFFAISNAAGMGGLTRIIPISNLVAPVKNTIEYATKLVKGPMDLKFLIFTQSTAGTNQPNIIMDFVKRRV